MTGEDEGVLIIFAETERNVQSVEKTSLLSVGVDIGSSTTHLVFSRLKMELKDGRYITTERQVIYDSDIFLTPYSDDFTIDAKKLGKYISGQYRSAQLRPEDIDTGALILTGLAVRRHNSRAIGELFAVETGKFVSVSAGDKMEAAMAAYGSGAIVNSREVGVVVMNIDIGGGTTKFSICDRGQISGLTAIDIGARIISFDSNNIVTRIEESGKHFAEKAKIDLSIGKKISSQACHKISEIMTDSLMEIIKCQKPTKDTEKLLRLPSIKYDKNIDAITFSGGVSEFIYGYETKSFGDLGPYLACSIRKRIEIDDYKIMPPVENIRATVVGASQYTIQLSGTTIMVSDDNLLPLRNIPVIKPEFSLDSEVISSSKISTQVGDALKRLGLSNTDQPLAICFDWFGSASYQRIDNFLSGIRGGLSGLILKEKPIILVCEKDIGRVFGFHATEEMKLENKILSIDGIILEEFDYIDIGNVIPATGAVPIVIKSLLFPTDTQLGDKVKKK